MPIGRKTIQRNSIEMKPFTWCTLMLGVSAACSVIIMLLTVKAAVEENQFRQAKFNLPSTDDERSSLIIKRSALLQEYIQKLDSAVSKLKQTSSHLRKNG